MAHACNPSTQETKEESLWVRGQPKLLSETLSQKTTTTKTPDLIDQSCIGSVTGRTKEHTYKQRKFIKDSKTMKSYLKKCYLSAVLINWGFIEDESRKALKGQRSHRRWVFLYSYSKFYYFPSN
jgi:hypothetical protein